MNIHVICHNLIDSCDLLVKSTNLFDFPKSDTDWSQKGMHKLFGMHCLYNVLNSFKNKNLIRITHLSRTGLA